MHSLEDKEQTKHSPMPPVHEREDIIIRTIERIGPAKLSEIVAETGLDYKATCIQIMQLHARGILRRKGRRRNARWSLPPTTQVSSIEELDDALFTSPADKLPPEGQIVRVKYRKQGWRSHAAYFPGYWYCPYAQKRLPPVLQVIAWKECRINGMIVTIPGAGSQPGSGDTL